MTWNNAGWRGDDGWYKNAVANPPTVVFIQGNVSSTGFGSATQTTTNADIGTANTNRRVIIVIGSNFNSNVVSATINGISCDASSIISLSGSTSNANISTASAVVPTGTTGVTIAVTYSAAQFSQMSLGIYTVDNTTLSSIIPVPSSFVETVLATTNTASVTALAGGFILAANNPGTGPGNTTVTGSGLVMDFTAVNGVQSNASVNNVTSGSHSGTFNWDNSVPDGMAMFAFR